MAPLSRGNTRRTGSSLRGRGGTFSRGRGGTASRARRRGFHGGGHGTKSTFYSTRVEEPLRDGDDESHSNGGEDLDESENISVAYSSEEDIEAYSSITKPYNELLQSLHADSGSGRPARKRQKLAPDYMVSNPAVDHEANNAMEDVCGTDLDYVEELEEGVDVQVEALDNGGSDNETEPASDPFEIHFASVDEKRLSGSIKDAAEVNLFVQKSSFDPGWKTLSTSYRSVSSLPGLYPRTVASVNNLQLKPKLEITAKTNLPALNGISTYITAQMFSYHDLLFCDRNADVAPQLRILSCLHALNHVFKTRDKVIKNNSRLAKIDGSDDVEYRDQGFTRPKVLMLLPTRQACVKAVDTMICLCEPEQQENKKRFHDSYVQTEDNFSEDKPADFRELFAGNDDDMFRLGIKFTRKTVKYFSQFYNSDIILTSPLGLRMAIGTDTKKRDYDFLSSIEVVIVDQADALLMQNWEHVEFIFEHLNLQPKEAHGCDFSRVRNWYLDGHARFLRQTIVFTAFNTPELNKIYGRHMMNIAGKTKICPEEYGGTMLDLGIQIKQTFSRYDALQPTADPDARFKYFTTAIIPMLIKSSKTTSRRGQGVLVFIPSYMDFVRVRNFLANSNSTQNISFSSISEYTSISDVARARSHFFSGRHSVLLYTGRAHHFRRYRLRGVKSIVMYALPDNPLFYQEIAGGYLATSISEGRIDSMEATVRSLFSKWDALRLERIVGTRRSVAMLREKGGDTFDFL